MANKTDKADRFDKFDKTDKMKALDAAIAHIEKQYGKGSVMKLGENRANMDVETVPTGSLSLDRALGLGGVPKGRIIEIYGPESSGKTTVTLHMVAEVQKLGGIAGFIDAEHALDPAYARNIGVDIDNLYISQPDNGEQALEIAETMVRSGAIDIVIIDSVAALVPKAEIDGARLAEITLALCAELLVNARQAATEQEARTKLQTAWQNGQALEHFARMVTLLGGPADFCDRPQNYLARAAVIRPVFADEPGYVSAMQTRDIGLALIKLKGGRIRSDQKLDYATGFSEFCQRGDYLDAQHPIALIHAVLLLPVF